jgi:hypothetical protein
MSISSRPNPGVCAFNLIQTEYRVTAALVFLISTTCVLPQSDVEVYFVGTTMTADSLIGMLSDGYQETRMSISLVKFLRAQNTPCLLSLASAQS